jgi:hypothetical protein
MNNFLHKNFKIKKNYYIFFLIFAFYFINNLDYIRSGLAIGDDWAYLYSLDLENFTQKIKRFLTYEYNTRPIGGIYLGLISLYEKNNVLYVLQNLILWSISILIISLKLKKEFNEKTAYIFLLIALFPSICSTIIFSSIVQSLGVLSIFFWSLSIKFDKLKFLSVIFITMAGLTYETALILTPINFYLWIKNKKINILLFVQYAFYFFLLFLTILLIQQLLAKFNNHYSTLKYFFQIKNGFIAIEEDFFDNIQKYFFKPFVLIIFEIPFLLIKTIKFYTIDFKNVFLFFVFLFINIFIFFKNKKNLVYKNNLIFFFYISIGILFNFFLYLIATSVPQINGYYNRGLVSLFILLSLFLSYFSYLKIKNNMRLTLNIFLITIILLNFSSFNIQKNTFIKNNLEQKKILNSFLELSYKKINPNENSTILAIVPTYNNINYNDELIFSEEMADIEFFFKLKYSKNVNVIRIYYDNICQNILNLNQNNLIANQPPRSRKKTKFTNEVIIENIKNKNIYVYIFNKDFFRVSQNNDDNLKKLSDNTKCSIY